MVRAIEVLQRDIKLCRYCGGQIAWLQNKAGKWYPVNVDYAMQHEAATHKTNFHRCTRRPA